ANGNDVTQNQTVTINDTTDPVAVCQDITILLDGTGNASITASDVDGGSTDNCAIASISIDISSFNTSNIGTNNVELTVTDTNGNTDTCIAVVTVEEDTLNLNDITLNNVTISPNPFGSSIYVTLPLAFNNSNFDVKIFDLNGRVVYNKVKSVSNGRFQINGLDNLAQAPYFIRIHSKLTGAILHKKLIKHE
ncbi:MAG: T9SS type A sorting domain-containing protein, partial [bacterium]